MEICRIGDSSSLKRQLRIFHAQNLTGGLPSSARIWSLTELKERLIRLLHTYKDCFAWDYTEMPGYEGNLVEHRLPIKQRVKMKMLNQRLIQDFMFNSRKPLGMMCDTSRGFNADLS